MEAEFDDYDKHNKWHHIYQKIHEESLDDRLLNKESRKSENKSLNRYKDVTPYDWSRIVLKRSDNNYINASLIKVESAQRQYILTQGPLAQTSGHFWLMIWEQNSSAVLMLNRLVERGQIKCHKYWPNGKEDDDCDELTFTDVNLKVAFIEETKSRNYIIRKFLLTDLESQQSREIFHFHYTSWPDFGLPESPASFLEYLYAVRGSGALDLKDYGPPVIHCSAGIGRSGTLCLVDSCLVMIEKYGRTDSVNLIDILLDMRKYRKGLIQTPEQLRFSYLAIIEGSKQYCLNQANDSSVPFSANNNSYISKAISPKIHRSFGFTEDHNPDEFPFDDLGVNHYKLDKTGDISDMCSQPLPPLPPRLRRSVSTTSQQSGSTSPEPDSKRSKCDTFSSVPKDMISSEDSANHSELMNNNINNSNNSCQQQELRQRVRDEKRRKTTETIDRIKRKQRESEDRCSSKRRLN
ncbi:tyrosine-protein phosphatase non-receptor type 2-like isoform X2 [Oppia nitens]|uniref:tyrosine-protein phosphatase non-receptor type 2-like isoform X2 n=1 Tax=Oppia nitens TaxID=1686743 RepID=UPI0023DAFE19|nr:tyrosine-protein phosphatase non-receptor type 2-like isoform X2 [Oppia nitens]